MYPDIHKVMEYLNFKRKKMQKHDEVKFKMRELEKANGKGTARQNRVVKVQKFIGELATLQDQLIEKELSKRDESKEDEDDLKKQEMETEKGKSKLERYQIKIDTDVVPNEEDPFQIIIPNNKKPFINKDINFNLFIEVLTAEVD